MYARFLPLSLLAAFLLTGAPDSARAAASEDGCLSDPVCNGHYEAALQQFEEGHYEAALTGFQAAYAQRQMPWLLVNIGRTLHRLGRLKEAVTYYERYQQSGSATDPETNQRVEGYLAQARVLLGKNMPQGTAGNSSALTTTTSPESMPLYKKWWFWTAIGGGVVAVTLVAVGIGVGVGNSGSGSEPLSQPMPSMLPTGVPVYRPSF